ncbi:hypothetical protein SCALM49S_02777 [Streptomyces californicus]
MPRMSPVVAYGGALRESCVPQPRVNARSATGVRGYDLVAIRPNGRTEPAMSGARYRRWDAGGHLRTYARVRHRRTVAVARGPDDGTTSRRQACSDRGGGSWRGGRPEAALATVVAVAVVVRRWQTGTPTRPRPGGPGTAGSAGRHDRAGRRAPVWGAGVGCRVLAALWLGQLVLLSPFAYGTDLAGLTAMEWLLRLWTLSVALWIFARLGRLAGDRGPGRRGGTPPVHGRTPALGRGGQGRGPAGRMRTRREPDHRAVPPGAPGPDAASAGRGRGRWRTT